MASITIRNLDEDIKHRLRVRAAERGRSMEEEVREILRRVMMEDSPPRDLAAAIRDRAASFGGIDLDLPEREPMREPPHLG
uniref:Antitoxin FitA-like ribbon-helix-helix domain-containing protein n=1 Tax=Candidatus Nitrotoga fabula TaxID=2182327 RepID=A0A2X0SFK7_9PROT|nr:conserved protein of unknown function [Candidatus Nitrotoga fabula]